MNFSYQRTLEDIVDLIEQLGNISTQIEQLSYDLDDDTEDKLVEIEEENLTERNVIISASLLSRWCQSKECTYCPFNEKLPDESSECKISTRPYLWMI